MVRINKEENDGKPIDNHYKLTDVFPTDSLKTNCPLPPQETEYFYCGNDYTHLKSVDTSKNILKLISICWDILVLEM